MIRANCDGKSLCWGREGCGISLGGCVEKGKGRLKNVAVGGGVGTCRV